MARQPDLISSPVACDNRRMHEARVGLALLTWAALGLACATPPASGPKSGEGADGVVIVGAGRGSERAPCQRPDEASIRPERKRALEAFSAGRLREAVTAFEAASRAHPEDLASQALLLASRERQATAASKTGPAFDNLPRMRLFPPRDGYKLVRAIDGVGTSQTTKLTRVSETPNLITDDDVWFKKHDVSEAELSRMRVRSEALPDAAPRTLLGARAQSMFSYPDHTIISYGPTLALLWPPNSVELFDVTGFAEITDARVVNQVLLLSTWRNGYSKDAGGKTGYIAAYSVRDGALLWQSEPLVTSMGGFVVTGEHIVSGYGFTAEPDFAYLLALANGKTLQKEALRSGPSMIVQRGDRILFRNYDTDAEFRLAPAPAAAPATGLPQQRDAGASKDERARLCQMERALLAIDRRSEVDLAKAIQELRREQADKEVVGALEGVHRFIQQQKGASPAIDLWSRPPVKLATPPWLPERRRAVGSPVTARPRLREISSASASAVRNMSPPGGAPFVPGRPSFLAPVLKGKLPAGARGDIPSSYGLEDLHAIIPDREDRLILVYGGRYLAVIRGNTTEALLDFESFLHPPKVDPQWAKFAVSDVTYALVREGVLFVANGGGSYAKEMGGKKGFVSALDLKTGELLWRSDPLVHGSGPFVIWRDFLVTGYGFTAEPDFVFMLRRDTGEVATKATIKSAPDDLQLSGDRLHVEAYEHVHDFELTAP